MKRIVATIIFALCAITAYGSDTSFKQYCEWEAHAAQAIAMNRDLGVSQRDVTKQYLEQQASYEEQTDVLKLIDQVYGPYKNMTEQVIFSLTKEQCINGFTKTIRYEKE